MSFKKGKKKRETILHKVRFKGPFHRLYALQMLHGGFKNRFSFRVYLKIALLAIKRCSTISLPKVLICSPQILSMVK